MGHCLAGFLRGGVCTQATPRGGGLDWNFHPNIPESLDIWMPRPEVMLPPKHMVTCKEIEIKSEGVENCLMKKI